MANSGALRLTVSSRFCCLFVRARMQVLLQARKLHIYRSGTFCAFWRVSAKPEPTASVQLPGKGAVPRAIAAPSNHHHHHHPQNTKNTNNDNATSSSNNNKLHTHNSDITIVNNNRGGPRWGIELRAPGTSRGFPSPGRRWSYVYILNRM